MSLVRTSVAGFITAGELIDSITPATVSAEDRGYRRGFSHGYAQAMDDMLLTINRGYSRPRDAWNILAAHHAQALLPWRQHSEERRVGKEGDSTCRVRWTPHH